jgi:hypothetical protein
MPERESRLGMSSGSSANKVAYSYQTDAPSQGKPGPGTASRTTRRCFMHRPWVWRAVGIFSGSDGQREEVEAGKGTSTPNPKFMNRLDAKTVIIHRAQHSDAFTVATAP